MDFRLTDEQRLVRDNARDFVDRELIPHVREWEEKGEIPKAFYRKMAGLGFLGAPVPEKYGGGGVGQLSFLLALREKNRRASSPGDNGSGQTTPGAKAPLVVGLGGQKGDTSPLRSKGGGPPGLA